MKLKPSEEFTGLTLEQWQSNSDNIVWAQKEPRFKMMLSAVLNQCKEAHATAAGCSEGRAFGRVEGYHMAVDILRALARRPQRDEPFAETTDRDIPENILKTGEPLD